MKQMRLGKENTPWCECGARKAPVDRFRNMVWYDCIVCNNEVSE